MTLGRKKRVKRERAIRPVITLLSKNGYSRFNSKRYIIDNKYQKAKIKNLEIKKKSRG